MAFLSTLYLETFVLITCFGLWYKNISGVAERGAVYRALCAVTIIVSLRVLFFCSLPFKHPFLKSFCYHGQLWYGILFAVVIYLYSFQGLSFRTT